ncbi:MAG: glycosyltransferase family 2 protein [Candidatus Humimicrobiaceae bacterium]
MKDSSSPFVSIITVNFNGIFFLKTLFDSIASLNYPKEKLQVIMVDNGSTDGSVSYVKSSYPFVEILKINKNLGFAGGNNEGAKAARGDYIAFINNDCAVEKDWLSSLVSIMREKEAQNIKIGGAGSKVLFYFKYLSLRISFDSFTHNNSLNEGKEGFKALIKGFKINAGNDEFSQNDPDGCGAYKKNLFGFANKSFKYPSGFCDLDRDEDKNIIRGVRNNAVVRVPVADISRDMELEFLVSFLEPPVDFKIFFENDNSDGAPEISLLANSQGEPDFMKVVLRIPSEQYRHCQSIVNSCGSMINKAFYAKEINYECADDESAVQPFEVFALPGSSFIINKKLVEETGLFDEKFFTYYEDIDFFWRAALKGWRFFAVPGSVSRHFHCGSGEEWSYGFTYHVLRNRLLMIYRCCWFSGFLKNYLSFCVAAFMNLLYLAAAKARKRELNRPDILIRIKIFFEFFILMALHLGKRFKIRTSSSVTDKSIKKWQQDF